MRRVSFSTWLILAKRVPLNTWLILGVFAALVVAVTIAEREFLSVQNIKDIGRHMSINAIIAVGMTAVILTGGIDLSVGSVLAFSGVLTAMALKAGVPVPIAVVAGVGIGAGLGAVNGALIALAKLPPFVVTLAMMVIARSLTRVVTGNLSIYDLPDSFAWFGGSVEGTAFGLTLQVPVPIILTIVIYAGAWILLKHYRFGRAVYAIGGNEEAARLSGIPVPRVKILVYTLAGALAAFAGVITTSRLGAADPTAGIMFELDAIAAVVVGGASLMGGRGHVLGTLLGVVMVATLQNAMVIVNVDPNWHGCVQGLVIIGAVLATKRRS